MLTRRRLTTVSPSLRLNEPSARRGGQSPSMGKPSAAAEEQPDPHHFRPITSPSLDLGDLLGSPASRNNSRCESPSLGLIARNALPFSTPAPLSGAPMTTAVCKRASRMARPAEPSPAAAAAALSALKEREEQFLSRNLLRLPTDDATAARFKLSNASTGKGPAVKAATGDSETDAAAQAKMNHVRFHASFTSEPLSDYAFVRRWCPSSRAMWSPATKSPRGCCPSRPAALPCTGAWLRRQSKGATITLDHSFLHTHPNLWFGSNAVNSSVTKREKTQGAANQVRFTPGTLPGRH